MSALIKRNHLSNLFLNVFTILMVAIMLIVNKAEALSETGISRDIQTLSALPYQGTLMDSEGNPISGKHTIRFRIYENPTGATPIWEEIRSGSNTVSIQNGLFNVTLGSLNPIPSKVWGASELYLGVKVDNDEEMIPRQVINPTPFALQAAVTSSIIDNVVTGDSIIDGSITQQEAPTLIQSFNRSNEIIQSGNSAFSESNANGEIEITYPCFPNGVRVFIATNGHYNANHSQVVAHNGADRCATTIIISPPTTNPIRINWVAIGN